MKSVDVIIPCSAMLPQSVEDRVENINFGLQHFFGNQTACNLRVIVIEQCLDGHEYFLPHIEEKYCEVEKVRIDWPKFNKQWCINVAAKHYALSDNICVAESDMWSDEDYFAEALEYFDARGLRWMFLWNRLYYTEPEEKDKILASLQLREHVAKQICIPRHGYSEGGVVMFKKELLLGIGGGNEWIEELGGPDNDLASRSFAATRTYDAFNAMVYHLSHPGLKKTRKGQRKKNIAIIRDMSKDPKRHNRYLRRCNFGDKKAPLCSKGDFYQLIGKDRAV